MLTLTQSVTMRGSSGEPLPVVWESLESNGTRFLRGQLVLIAAPPGVGKSAFTLSYALRSKVSCLYFSADSDAAVQVPRSLAVLKGIDMKQAENMVLNPDYDEIQGITQDSPVGFDYTPSPSLDTITQQVRAYEEMYGDYPELIVVDNALDVVMEGADIDQSQSLDALMAWLHDLARSTKACVTVLHHVTGPYNDASQPIPLSGVKGQVGRVPEMILTLHKSLGGHGYPDELRVSTVKNRGQKADPSGQSYVPLDFDGYRMSITDQQQLFEESPFDDRQERDHQELEAWMG